MFKLNRSKIFLILMILLFSLILPVNETNAAGVPKPAFQDSSAKTLPIVMDSSRVMQVIDSTGAEIIPDSVKLDTTGIDSQAVQALEEIKFVFRSEKDGCIDTTLRLDRTEFAILIHEDLGDLLKHIPGINLYDPVSAGQPEYAGFHGSRPEQVTVLINGCPITHDQFGALDLKWFPVEAIRRIEVSGDPADFPYPNSGGSINIITRKFEGGNRPRSYIMYHKGARNYSDVDVMFGQKISKAADINAGIIYNNYGGDYSHSRYEAQKIRNQFTSYLGADWFLNYFVLYNKSDVDIPGEILLENNQPSTPSAHEKVVRYDHAINFRGNIFADSTEDLLVNLYYTSRYKEFRDHPNGIDETNRYGFGGLRFEGYLPLGKQNFTLGGDYQYRYMHSAEMGQRGNHRIFFFIRDVFPLAAWARLKLLGRFECHNKFDTFFSPNAALESTWKSSTKIALHFSLSRRQPNYYELYRDNLYRSGNQDLKPEKLASVDAVLSTKLFKVLDVRSCLFLRRVIDPIRITAIPDTVPATFSNQAKDTFYGVDGDFCWQNHKKWTAGLKCNLLFAYDENSRRLPDLPLVYGYTYFDFFRNFFKDDLKLHGRFTLRLFGPRWSPQRAPDESPYVYSASMVELPTESVPDFKIVGVIRDVQLFWSIENILGCDYQPINGYPARGRTIHWGLTWQFWD